MRCDHSCLKEFTACRLIPLDKGQDKNGNPGVRPIGIGEILRRIIGKAVIMSFKTDIQYAAGPLQTCAGLKSGIEASIHAMRQIWEDSDTEAILQVDADNAFNRLNREAALHNVHEICPPLYQYLKNHYQKPADLIINTTEDHYQLKSEEGSTQGDVAAMAFYALGIKPLVDDLATATKPSVCKQSWYADDSSAGGKIGGIKIWWDTLLEQGPKYGYYPKASKKGNKLLSCIKKYMILNKLHINMSKCCYIHFKPKASKPVELPDSLQLHIDGFPIKKTKATKFLGVVIDEQLSWGPHITALKRKLNYATATLNRIRDSVPKELHKDLYHTLFESHLTYCISVWGDAALFRTASIWLSQKHCVRVLFGDKEAYLNKFLTCARTREFDNQALDHTFFQLEHCKPLFKQQNILAFKNLYTYHTFMEVFKILKLRCPTSLNQHYQLSSRKQTALIAQLPSNDFISRSTKIWSTIAPKLKLFDFSYKISLAKSRLKKSLLKLQHAYNDSAWTSSDYDMMKLSFENNPLQKI